MVGREQHVRRLVDRDDQHGHQRCRSGGQLAQRLPHDPPLERRGPPDHEGGDDHADPGPADQRILAGQDERRQPAGEGRGQPHRVSAQSRIAHGGREQEGDGDGGEQRAPAVALAVVGDRPAGVVEAEQPGHGGGQVAGADDEQRSLADAPAKRRDVHRGCGDGGDDQRRPHRLVLRHGLTYQVAEHGRRCQRRVLDLTDGQPPHRPGADDAGRNQRGQAGQAVAVAELAVVDRAQRSGDGGGDAEPGDPVGGRDEAR